MAVKWIERFVDHWYLDSLTHGYDVHCRPHMDGGWVGMVDVETSGRSLFFDRCATLDEAKGYAAAAYKIILIAALNEVNEC